MKHLTSFVSTLGSSLAVPSFSSFSSCAFLLFLLHLDRITSFSLFSIFFPFPVSSSLESCHSSSAPPRFSSSRSNPFSTLLFDLCGFFSLPFCYRFIPFLSRLRSLFDIAPFPFRALFLRASSPFGFGFVPFFSPFHSCSDFVRFTPFFVPRRSRFVPL